MCGGAGGVARAQAELDTAMVMTFGAVAASKLPPKRRPRLDPRVLDSLLNGTPCDYASSCAPLAPHCAPCVWSQVSTCHRRRPRTTFPQTRRSTPVSLTRPSRQGTHIFLHGVPLGRRCARPKTPPYKEGQLRSVSDSGVVYWTLGPASTNIFWCCRVLR